MNRLRMLLGLFGVLAIYFCLLEVRELHVTENSVHRYFQGTVYSVQNLFVKSDKPFTATPHMFDCTNIDRIKIIGQLGLGTTKKVLLGDYMGRHVAVKIVLDVAEKIQITQDYHEAFKKDISSMCTNDLNNTRIQLLRRSRNYSPLHTLLKETLMVQQLNHKGLVRLLGHCMYSSITSANISYRGPVTVFEVGQTYNNAKETRTLSQLSWQDRLKYAIQLTDLLDYLENSPLGSLALIDLKLANFVSVNGYIKLADMESLSASRISCDRYKSMMSEMSSRKNHSRCGDGHASPEFSAIYNMFRMNKACFSYLLSPKAFPDNMMSAITKLTRALNDTELSALTLKRNLTSLQRHTLL